MPQYTARFTTVFEVLVGDRYSLNGRTQTYIPTTAKLVGADRYEAQTWILSAGLSAQAVQLSPLGVDAPMQLALLVTDHPVDVRFNAANDTLFLSSVQMMPLAAVVSNLFITTGDYDTTLQLLAAGGSNATLTVSLPLP